MTVKCHINKITLQKRGLKNLLTQQMIGQRSSQLNHLYGNNKPGHTPSHWVTYKGAWDTPSDNY